MSGKRKLVAFLFAILGLVLALSVGGMALSEFTEPWFWAIAFHVRGAKKPDPRISIVGIDDTSIAYLEEAGITYPPFPRSFHAKLIDKLSESGAKIIIFDILFSTESWDESEDEALRDAIIRARQRGTTVILSALWEITEQVPGASLEAEVEQAVLELPAKTILQAQPEIAIVSALQKLSYKYKEISHRDYQGTRYYSQATQALRVLLKEKGELESFDSHPELYGISKYGDFLINYYGPSGKTIPTYPIATLFPEITEPYWEKREGEMVRLRPSLFKDGIVFVGSVAKVDNDYFMTPFDEMFGVETNAQALNTLLKRDFITPVDPRVTALIWLLITITSWALVVYLRPLRSFFSFVVLSMLFEFFLVAMFVYGGVLMEFTNSTVAFFGTFFFTLSFRVFTEEAEKHKIRSTFGRYVSPQVVNELIANPKLAELGGVEREVALLFSDIRNYSTISEGLSPHQVVDFLNRFLSIMSDVIMNCGGFVDKFMGDGIMAVFGAPVPLENPCASAVEAGLKMVEAVYDRWQEMVGDLPIGSFRIGVGIHYGKVVVGNVGSGKRMDYTCIGDVVNVASRLESETKRYRQAVLISEEVFQRLGDSFKCEYVAQTMVKGRRTPTKIYRVIHPRGEEITDIASAVSQAPQETSYAVSMEEEAEASASANPRE